MPRFTVAGGKGSVERRERGWGGECGKRSNPQTLEAGSPYALYPQPVFSAKGAQESTCPPGGGVQHGRDHAEVLLRARHGDRGRSGTFLRIDYFGGLSAGHCALFGWVSRSQELDLEFPQTPLPISQVLSFLEAHRQAREELPRPLALLRRVACTFRSRFWDSARVSLGADEGAGRHFGGANHAPQPPP